jgi:hypothetical protein
MAIFARKSLRLSTLWVILILMTILPEVNSCTRHQKDKIVHNLAEEVSFLQNMLIDRTIYVRIFPYYTHTQPPSRQPWSLHVSIKGKGNVPKGGWIQNDLT